jgi:hypothetical protein
MDVAVQVSIVGSYRPPNATDDPSALPPQTIMTFPVQTLVAPFHPAGDPIAVGVQEFVTGL